MPRIEMRGGDELRRKLRLNIPPEQVNAFLDKAARELAARFLAKVVKKTPVGEGIKETVTDANGKKHTVTKTVGGTLRRGWTAKTEEEAARGGSPQDVTAAANALPVERSGNSRSIELINPVKYASYVEYGHRQTPGRYVPVLGKRLVKSWVDGQFMMTNSANEMNDEAPAFLRALLRRYAQEIMNAE